MLNILDPFINYIKCSKNNSLIARIYGMFSIKTAKLDPIDFIIMQNTSKLFNESNQDIQFDLKGNLISRRININIDDKSTMRNKVLLDVNFIEI